MRARWAIVVGILVVTPGVSAADLRAQAPERGSWSQGAAAEPQLATPAGTRVVRAPSRPIAGAEPAGAAYGFIFLGTAVGSAGGAALGYYAGRAIASDNVQDSMIGPPEPLVGGLLGALGGAWLGARLSNSWRGDGGWTALGTAGGLAAGIAVGVLLESTTAGVVVGVGIPAYAEWASSR